MDDEELPEQPILDDHQNGLCNHHNKEDGRQNRDSPVGVPSRACDGEAWGTEVKLRWSAADTAYYDQDALVASSCKQNQ